MNKQILRITGFVILTAAFVALAIFVTKGGLPFDEPIGKALRQIRSPILTEGFTFITFFADTKTLIVLCIGFLFVPWTRIYIGIPLTIATGLAALIKSLLKDVIERDRPDAALQLISETGYSFPSGHATGGLVFYLLLGILAARYLYAKKEYLQGYFLRLLTYVLIFLIGISRIYLGVHFASDILGGYCLGGAFLIVFISAYDAFYPPGYRL
jgi:undecaprenyl-diphosphatase